jgi:flavin reductase (DIM6/NTAB) family NADH-FMN oxidoreductase RutF
MAISDNKNGEIFMLKNVTFKEALDVWSKPERLVFVTSLDTDGTPRVMTVGWITRASFRPPMLAVAIAQNRTMHQCIRHSNEFVVAVPGEEQAKQTLICGSASENGTDRFKECGFITKPGSLVKVPIIENCLVNFECRVVDQIDSGDHTVFIGEVLSTWMNEKFSANVLLIGMESGYQVLAEEGPYRVGVVRDNK